MNKMDLKIRNTEFIESKLVRKNANDDFSEVVRGRRPPTHDPKISFNHNIQNTTEYILLPLHEPFTGKEGFSTC